MRPSVTREAGVELLKPGDIIFCVLARSETNEFGRHVYASLGLAGPAAAGEKLSVPNPAQRNMVRKLTGWGIPQAAYLSRGNQSSDRQTARTEVAEYNAPLLTCEECGSLGPNQSGRDVCCQSGENAWTTTGRG